MKQAMPPGSPGGCLASFCSPLSRGDSLPEARGRGTIFLREIIHYVRHHTEKPATGSYRPQVIAARNTLGAVDWTHKSALT